MDELIKDYGYKGIDTPEERARINYNPVLSYIRQVVGEEKKSLIDKFEPSNDLAYAIKYNIPAARAAVKEAESSLESCFSLLKEALKDKVVPISDGPQSEMVKGYAGADYINFSTFDRSCREGTEPAKATRNEFIEGLDLIEAYAYYDMVQLAGDLEECKETVDKKLPEIAVAAGYVVNENDIDKATEERIRTWIDWEMFEFFRLNIPEEQYFSDLNEAVETKFNLNADPVPTVSRFVISKAYDIDSLSESFKNLILLDVSDIVANEINDVIRGVLRGVGLSLPGGYQDKYQRAKESLTTLRVIMTLTNATFTAKALDLMDIISTLTSPLLQEVTKRILYALSLMKIQITLPALQFLERIEEEAGVNLRTIDLIANAIMDKANEIETKFQDIILDAYRNTKERTENIAEKIGTLEKKKWIKTILKIIDAIEWGIDRISPEQINEIFNAEVDTSGYVYEIVDHLGWFDKNNQEGEN